MNDGNFPRDAARKRGNAARLRGRFPTRVDGIVESVLAKRKMSTRVAEARILQAFMDVAGEAVRKHVRPTGIKGGAMTIAVDSATWRQQLQLLGEDLRKKTNKKIGRDALSTLIFIHGTPASADAFAPVELERPLCPLRDASAEELAEADKLSRLVSDPELATILAHAYLNAKRSGRT